MNDNRLLDVLTREGVLLNVSVRFWRAAKKLQAQDLGLDPDDVAERLISLGHKRLLPKEALAEFALIESRTHALVDASTFPFLNGIGHFLPNAKLAEVTARLDGLESESHPEARQGPAPRRWTTGRPVRSRRGATFLPNPQPKEQPMKYWDAFQSKWGFDDGEAVPPDAWASRYVYIREINRLAAANGSAARLVAFDRPGCHNPYLVCRVSAGLVRDVPPTDLCKGANAGGWEPDDGWSEPVDDDALLAAINTAMDMNLDELVDTRVSISDKPVAECPVVV